jgi:hypothetical protein
MIMKVKEETRAHGGCTANKKNMEGEIFGEYGRN